MRFSNYSVEIKPPAHPLFSRVNSSSFQTMLNRFKRQEWSSRFVETQALWSNLSRIWWTFADQKNQSSSHEYRKPAATHAKRGSIRHTTATSFSCNCFCGANSTMPLWQTLEDGLGPSKTQQTSVGYSLHPAFCFLKLPLTLRRSN